MGGVICGSPVADDYHSCMRDHGRPARQLSDIITVIDGCNRGIGIVVATAKNMIHITKPPWLMQKISDRRHILILPSGANASNTMELCNACANEMGGDSNTKYTRLFHYTLPLLQLLLYNMQQNPDHPLSLFIPYPVCLNSPRRTPQRKTPLYSMLSFRDSPSLLRI
jgi:hypothetical protein